MMGFFNPEERVRGAVLHSLEKKFNHVLNPKFSASALNYYGNNVQSQLGEEAKYRMQIDGPVFSLQFVSRGGTAM